MSAARPPGDGDDSSRQVDAGPEAEVGTVAPQILQVAVGAEEVGVVWSGSPVGEGGKLSGGDELCIGSRPSPPSASRLGKEGGG